MIKLWNASLLSIFARSAENRHDNRSVLTALHTTKEVAFWISAGRFHLNLNHNHREETKTAFGLCLWLYWIVLLRSPLGLNSVYWINASEVSCSKPPWWGSAVVVCCWGGCSKPSCCSASSPHLALAGQHVQGSSLQTSSVEGRIPACTISVTKW